MLSATSKERYCSDALDTSLNLKQLDLDEDVICFCHHGMRSLDVANWLRGKG